MVDHLSRLGMFTFVLNAGAIALLLFFVVQMSPRQIEPAELAGIIEKLKIPAYLLEMGIGASLLAILALHFRDRLELKLCEDLSLLLIAVAFFVFVAGTNVAVSNLVEIKAVRQASEPFKPELFEPREDTS
jgi:hypothetical protein